MKKILILLLLILPIFIFAKQSNNSKKNSTLKGFWVLNQLQIVDQKGSLLKERRDYNPYFKSSLIYFDTQKKQGLLLTSIPFSEKGQTKVPGKILKDSFNFSQKSSLLKMQFKNKKNKFPSDYYIVLQNSKDLVLAHNSTNHKKVLLYFKKFVPAKLEGSTWALKTIFIYKNSKLLKKIAPQNKIAWSFQKNQRGQWLSDQNYSFIWNSKLMYFKLSLFLSKEKQIESLYKILFFDKKNFLISSLSQNNTVKVFYFVKK